MFNRLAVALVTIGFATTASAAVVSAGSSTIGSIETYTEFGGGDAIVHLTTNSLQASCPYGFWIRGTDAGAKSALAQIIAAHTAGGSVVIYADTSTIWSGAGSAACLVWDVVAQ